MNLPDRFTSKFDVQPDGCWIWNRAKSRDGYGVYTVKSKNIRAHRFAFEAAYGSIPDGMQVDHLCRVRDCVNPQHLEAVTPRENSLRGEGAPGLFARRDTCSNGHALEGENVYQRRDRGRGCRECDRARNLKCYHARKARA